MAQRGRGFLRRLPMEPQASPLIDQPMNFMHIPEPSYHPTASFPAEELTGWGHAIQDHKNGFFQRLSFTATWIDRDTAGGYGVTELESSLRFGTARSDA